MAEQVAGEPDRVIDGRPFWWSGHYLTDEEYLCPHRVWVGYRCSDCDRDHGGAVPGPRTVTR